MSQSDHDLTVAATLVAGTHLTLTEATALKAAWLPALSNCTLLILDLGAVEQFDLAGAQLLLLLQRQAVAEGKQLQLANVSAPVRATCALLRIFPQIETDTAPLAMPPVPPPGMPAIVPAGVS